MAQVGINIRATAGYVTDGTNEDYSLGGTASRSLNGFSWLWDQSMTGASRDRSSSAPYSPNLAGVVFRSNTSSTPPWPQLRITLPATGQYQIRIAAGDATNAQNQYFRLIESTTTFATVTNASTPAGSFADATGAVYTGANWSSSNTAVTRTFTSTDFRIEIGDPTGSGANSSTLAHVFVYQVPDTTAPVLSSPTGTSTGSTTATVGATTDEGNGTMYAVVTTSVTQPSVAQIKAGQNDAGTAAAYSGSQAISNTGAKTFGATGLTASTTYYAHLVHTDAASNDSNRVTSASFTTSAGASSDNSAVAMTQLGALSGAFVFGNRR